MRIHRYYEPYEYQAGTPVKIVTIPYEEDLAALLEDIRRAREKADVVLVSIHWGVHFIAKVIADYQPVVGHAALDAGADAILGHHAHILKAVEVYKGKPIYYSMCNFALDSPGGAAIGKLYGLPITDDPAYPFPPDARKTLVATLTLSKKGVERAGFLPAFVEKGGKPVLLERSDPRFDDVVSYMEWLSDEFPHTFSIEGNEVILKP